MFLLRVCAYNQITSVDYSPFHSSCLRGADSHTRATAETSKGGWDSLTKPIDLHIHLYFTHKEGCQLQSQGQWKVRGEKTNVHMGFTAPTFC